MADAAIEALYRTTFADRVVAPEENAALVAAFQDLSTVKNGATSPPALTPDKLVWLRAAAFRVGCDFLAEDRAENVKLLRAVNAVVHALETTCLLPALPADGGPDFSRERVEELYGSLYATEPGDDAGPVVTTAEAAALHAFLTDGATRPPLAELVWLRSTAFRLGSQYLDDGNDRAKNVALLRSINVIVHAVETTCMKSRPLVLALPPSHTPTADTDFATAAQTLWNLDANRLVPHKDYKMDVQRSKHPSNRGDAARDPLFTYVHGQVLERPTFRAFRHLLDNYAAVTGEEEVVTSQELRENRAFLDAVLQTAPMKYCHKYCLAKGVEYCGRAVPADERGFRGVLDAVWFKLYSRSGGGRRRKMDSSGFEHVFVGEVKNGQVSGFHNWIQFYLEEKKGNVDYRGYIKPRSRNSAETNNDDPVLTLQFSWNGVEKFIGTSFIGVSPEFELALYTLAFLAGEEENLVTLDTGNGEAFDLKVICHKYDRGSKIGSSYVEALAHYEE